MTIHELEKELEVRGQTLLTPESESISAHHLVNEAGDIPQTGDEDIWLMVFVPLRDEIPEEALTDAEDTLDDGGESPRGSNPAEHAWGVGKMFQECALLSPDESELSRHHIRINIIRETLGSVDVVVEMRYGLPRGHPHIHLHPELIMIRGLPLDNLVDIRESL